MLNKLTINLIAFLMCLCMVSVGFSAWTITAETQPATVGGSITADMVIKSDEYVSVKSVAGFEYHKEGFVVDGKASDTATYTLTFEIDNAALRESFGANISNVTVEFALKSGEALYNASPKEFPTYEFTHPDFSTVTYNGTGLNSSTSSPYGTYSVNIALTSAESQDFTVVYNFNYGKTIFAWMASKGYFNSLIATNYPLELTIKAIL